MIQNMKLATKVLSGFIAIALIAAGIGIFAIIEIRAIDEADTKLYEMVTVPLAKRQTLRLISRGSGSTRAT